MARRWLLRILAGAALSIGVASGPAMAQELSPGDDTVTADAGVAAVSVSVDDAERTLTADAATDVALPDADTTVAPTAAVELAPDGADLDVAGTTEAAGTPVPVPEVSDPVEDVLEAPPVDEPDVVDEVAETVTPPATGTGDTATPAPATEDGADAGTVAPAPSTDAGPPADRSASPSPDRSVSPSADRAAVRAGLHSPATMVATDAAPEVAPPAEQPPLVAAAPPATAGFGLPIIDTTPTVPGLLRLLTGLMVVGAAATWRTVRSELA